MVKPRLSHSTTSLFPGHPPPTSESRDVHFVTRCCSKPTRVTDLGTRRSTRSMESDITEVWNGQQSVCRPGPCGYPFGESASFCSHGSPLADTSGTPLADTSGEHIWRTGPKAPGRDYWSGGHPGGTSPAGIWPGDTPAGTSGQIPPLKRARTDRTHHKSLTQMLVYWVNRGVPRPVLLRQTVLTSGIYSPV